jgi:NTE family protein
MASSAILFVFPSFELPMAAGLQWFGDGSMRQTAPLSCLIHLGEEKVLVIGAGRMHEPPGRQTSNLGYPSLAQIA